jgi:hypothetical protein
VFVALAAVAWADGSMSRDEADAIVRAALVEGLSFEDVEHVDHAVTHPVALSTLDRRKITDADRLYVYAVATWIARLDGRQHPRTREVLEGLGATLNIPASVREEAERIAAAIAERPQGSRPALYDLSGLRDAIEEELGHVALSRVVDDVAPATLGAGALGRRTSQPEPTVPPLSRSAEAELRALAHAVLAVALARGVALSDAARRAIEACRERATLEGWLRRAAVAQTEGEILP